MPPTAQKGSGPVKAPATPHGRSQSLASVKPTHKIVTEAQRKTASAERVRLASKASNPLGLPTATIAGRRAATKASQVSGPGAGAKPRPKPVPAAAASKGPATKKVAGKGGDDDDDEEEEESSTEYETDTTAFEKEADASSSYESETESETEDGGNKGGKGGGGGGKTNNPFKGKAPQPSGQKVQRLRDQGPGGVDDFRETVRVFFLERIPRIKLADQTFVRAEGIYNKMTADLVWAEPADPWRPALEDVDWDALGLNKSKDEVNNNNKNNDKRRKPSPDDDALVAAEGAKVFKTPLFSTTKTRRLLMWMQHMVEQEKKVVEKLEAKGIFGDDQQPPGRQLDQQPPDVRGLMRDLYDVRAMGRRAFERAVRLAAHTPLVTGGMGMGGAAAGGNGRNGLPLLQPEQRRRMNKYMHRMGKYARRVRQKTSEIIAYYPQAGSAGMDWDALGMDEWDWGVIDTFVWRGRAASLLWLDAFEAQQRSDLKEARDARPPPAPTGGQAAMQKKIMANLRGKQKAEKQRANKVATGGRLAEQHADADTDTDADADADVDANVPKTKPAQTTTTRPQTPKMKPKPAQAAKTRVARQ